MADRGSADKLFSDAAATLQSAGGRFMLFGSRSEKYEDAAEKFKEAGSVYRTLRDLQKSGQAFEKSAEVHRTHLNDPLEAAKMLQDAFKSYREASPLDAVRCLDQSIQLYTQKGNFRRAADMMVELADTYETKLEDPKKALECLDTAITWYSDEGIQATANKARSKAGQLAASQGDYYKAVAIFVKGAEASASTGPTGRFIIKTYLFKAGICQLATGDLIGSKKALEGWNELDRGFDQEREGIFLKNLLESMEQQDADRFAQLAHEWDRMTKMEDWMVAVLLQAKKQIEQEDDDFA